MCEFDLTNKIYLYSESPFILGSFSCFNSIGDIGCCSYLKGKNKGILKGFLVDAKL